MQGKNFTAAEKHFNEKCLKCKKKLQEKKVFFEDQTTRMKELTEQNIKLQNQNVQLQDWIERLIEHIDIPKEDLKILLEKEKNKKALSDSLSFMLDFAGRFGL